MKLLPIFIIIFIVLEVAGFFVTKSFRDKEINNILDNTFKINKVLYKSILDSFQDNADLIFDNIMENKNRIEDILSEVENNNSNIDFLRNELHSLIEDKYRNYNLRYSVRQIHFHLPNAISFLRMHKPEKFGDSLWNIRSSLRDVNNKKEIVRGFEEGRIFNGFRNVYPIYKGSKFVGSVEISFSFQSIRSQAMRLLPFHYKFMINKDFTEKATWSKYKAKNYIESDLSSDFYYDEKAESQCEHHKYNHIFLKTIDSVNIEIVDIIKNRLQKFESFTVFTENSNNFFTISFLPIKSVSSENSAYFIAYEENNDFIRKEFIDMNQRLVFFTISLLLALTLIYLFIIKELEIRELNRTLEEKISVEIRKSREKDNVILQQSKLSAMAEMINSIAHQWRQPLNRISLEMINIEEDFLYDELSEENLLKYSEGINENIQYLSRTIDDFRDFYKPVDKQDVVNIIEVMNYVLTTIESDGREKEVLINFSHNIKDVFYINYAKELKQVLINLISNSIDSVEKTIGKIDVNIKEHKENIEISISDNGKGIKEEIANRVFEPYFTTKFENQGTGMGLYVSKITIETNMGGSLSFQNIENGGVIFFIKLPK